MKEIALVNQSMELLVNNRSKCNSLACVDPGLFLYIAMFIELSHSRAIDFLFIYTVRVITGVKTRAKDLNWLTLTALLIAELNTAVGRC